MFLLIGVPIAFVFGISALISVWAADLPLVVIAHRFYSGLNDFTLMAIPFFLLAGMLMDQGGLSRRIIDFASALVGWATGSLLMVSVVASTAIAAMSGSGSADTAVVSAVMQPELKRRKYDVDFSAALIATAGTLAQIIPPSMMLVLIGVLNNISISALFLAGIIPGLLVVPGLLFLAWWHARNGGPQYRVTEPFQLQRLWTTFFYALPALGLGVIVSGGIFSGAFTPTEAAAVAVVYTILIGKFVYRELDLKVIPGIILKAGGFTAGIMVLVGGATVFNWLMAIEGLPDLVASWLQATVSSPWTFLLIVNIFLMLFGMPMESIAMVLLLSPVVIQAGVAYGLEPVHLAIVFVFNSVIGMITPPFGGTLFVAAIVAKRPISAVTRHIYRPWGVMTIVLLLVTYIPELVLFLPRAAGFLK
ncbi:TRAP transporter large permease [Microvirga antarctica]|uniref:TRAP transporter large permease n=1 Tax=Microvirga antarctica TaxID=2819233 RepID=UPI001B303714